MSKEIKTMQIEALTKSLAGARDLVLLSMSGVKAHDENMMRLALRKKNVRLQLVKNSLAKRVLKDQGLAGLDNYFNGPTVIAHSIQQKGGGVSEIAKELEPVLNRLSEWWTEAEQLSRDRNINFTGLTEFDQPLETGEFLGRRGRLAQAFHFARCLFGREPVHDPHVERDLAAFRERSVFPRRVYIGWR